ncbi:hypothetical protein GCM10022285_32980 [Streptomyces tunisiensis]|uniref:Uncharacterized protein n=1 Tax=Streptomyces tunisiensis TaxID=948699 RepID=A0ABP7YJJ3_9ACTN
MVGRTAARHLYAVLARSGISLCDHVRAQRLAECRRELAGPHGRARTIAPLRLAPALAARCRCSPSPTDRSDSFPDGELHGQGAVPPPCGAIRYRTAGGPHRAAAVAREGGRHGWGLRSGSRTGTSGAIGALIALAAEMTENDEKPT